MSEITTPDRPPWPRKKLAFSPEVHRIKRLLREMNLRSVCEDARCPNISECFARREATFIVLGDVCTRSCRFCSIPVGKPAAPDADEPMRLAHAAAEIGLSHVVITAVARDDLKDGGASHFAACIRAVRNHSPDTTVEVLTPDFKGSEDCLRTVADEDLQIFNHNVETTEALHKSIRPQGRYTRSLEVLSRFKEMRPDVVTKSGLMVGLGESDEDVFGVLRDMRRHNIDVVTIGQYLRPMNSNAPVHEYSSLERFKLFEDFGRGLGFALTLSGPYVRSSFGAAEAARVLGIRSPKN